jgi:hypothetical protein
MFSKERKLAAVQRLERGVPSDKWHGRWTCTRTCCIAGGVRFARGRATCFHVKANDGCCKR